MNGAEPLGQAVVRVAVLPARAAYLIRPGSADGLRRAVQEASTRWGGATEPIIPVRQSGKVDALWAQVVELSDIDGLVNVDLDPVTAKAAATALGLPVVPLIHIDRMGITHWSVHTAHVSHAQRVRGTDNTVMATTNADLWEVIAAGDLTEAGEADMADTVLFPRRPSTSDQVGRAQLDRSTLIDLTTSQFRERSASPGPVPAPSVLWVTTPNSFKDCLWFWNMRALRPLRFEDTPMVIVPHRAIDHWVDYGRSFSGVLFRDVDIEPDVILCSLSVPDERLSEIAESLGLVRSQAEPRNIRQYSAASIRQQPHTYRLDLDPISLVVFERRYGETADALVQMYRQQTTIRIPSPVTLLSLSPVLARFASSAFDGLPRRRATARLIHQYGTWSGDELQVVLGHGDPIQVDLNIPAPINAVWALAKESTRSASPSDKGQLAMRLDELALSNVLLDDHVVEVIQALTTLRSKELERDLRRLKDEGHPDTELREIASAGGRAVRRYRSTEQVQSLVHRDAHRAAESLAALGWAERGLEIRCNQCTIRSFVPLEATKGRPICPACDAEQRFESSKSGLRLQYRLHGLVDRASDQGVVPHLLAVAALTAADASTCLIPGMNVELGREREKAEVDLFGIYNGKVIAGEAKTGSQSFTNDQIDRDVRLSTRLGADAHLMVSPTRISATSLAYASDTAQRAGLQLIAVEGSSVRVDP